MTSANLALPSHAAPRRPLLVPLAFALVPALAYLILQPSSADLAAQVYRTDLFNQVGFTLWNGQWFAGHHTMGYSVLFPPLASVLGPRLVGALATVASAILFERIARAEWGANARLGAIWFGAATATNLFTGRLTFALGVALALGAVLAAQREHPRLAIGLAVLAPLGSPIAGLFLALAAGAHWVATRHRLSLLVAGAAFVSAVCLAAAFPEGGRQPFAWNAFWPTIAFVIAVLAIVPREERILRYGAAAYGLACLAAFLVDTPMGGNAVRLGTLFGGPLLACVLWRRRNLALALLAVPILYWQWVAPVRDVSAASGDPAVQASYYLPLNTFLHGVRPSGRVEILPTRNHWETVFVAPRFALARGWERQLDIKYNRIFYTHRLDPIDYRGWLSANSVQYVAVPEARLDYAAVSEARLVRRGVDYLEPVWGNADWRVYRFRYAVPLVQGPAHLVSLSPNAFTVRASGPGVVDVRVRYTRYWKIETGAGCVESAPGGLTRLRLTTGGLTRVKADFAPGRLVDADPRCRGPHQA
ncbi:MAG: hypothetical protein QOE65_1214 [Solirubrobacteraceae bacterium]|jgi:hypothetical protein|nr:hypothetical protein [Solirubrobacteraceae bacterium]